jgi:hypothetical protein
LTEARTNFANRQLFPQYFMGCVGIKVPLWGSELGNRPISSILYFEEDGEILQIRNVVLNNQETLFIEAKAKSFTDWNIKERLFSIWLLPEKDYSIKQMDVKSLDGELMYRVENSNYKNVSSRKIILPHSVIVSCYTYGTLNETILPEALFKEEYTLIEVSTKKINTKQFSLDELSMPGTLVGDRTLKDTQEGLVYTIPANPADLDRVIEAALSGKDFTPTPLPSRTAMIIRWILILLGLAMILYAGYKKFIKKS